MPRNRFGREGRPCGKTSEMNLPEQPFRAFDGTRFATARDRRLWNLWLAAVALIIVGSLIAWLLIIRSPVQGPTARSTDTRTAQATPSENTSWSRHRQHTTPVPPVAGPGIVWVNTRSKVYHYPGYRWYGATQAGKFVSETDALAEGDRAALNERRPMSFYATPRP